MYFIYLLNNKKVFPNWLSFRSPKLVFISVTCENVFFWCVYVSLRLPPAVILGWKLCLLKGPVAVSFLHIPMHYPVCFAETLVAHLFFWLVYWHESGLGDRLDVVEPANVFVHELSWFGRTRRFHRRLRVWAKIFFTCWLKQKVYFLIVYKVVRWVTW